MSPSFQVLRIHEKEGQHVVFDEGNEEMATETQRDTELTKFFKLNEENRKAKEEVVLTAHEAKEQVVLQGTSAK